MCWVFLKKIGQQILQTRVLIFFPWIVCVQTISFKNLTKMLVAKVPADL